MYYNKSTRNLDGGFSRSSGWGVERLPKGREENFTEIEPHMDSNGNPLPQDWVDGAWVIASDEVLPAEISKLDIIDRLIALEKAEQALTLLGSDAVKKARWDAATVIYDNDTDVIAVLTAIEVDPNDILF